MNGLAKAGNVVSFNWFFTHLAGGCLKLTTLAEHHTGVQRWLKVGRPQGTSGGFLSWGTVCIISLIGSFALLLLI